MTYAYVLCFGEYGEGHDPVSVHDSLFAALDEADRQFGVRPTHAGGVQWRATRDRDGVDEIVVRRFTIRGAR